MVNEVSHALCQQISQGEQEEDAKSGKAESVEPAIQHEPNT
jgi:hypothetical protein